MSRKKVAVRVFLDDEDYNFIMENKRESGVSLQKFVTSSVKYSIAEIKKELMLIKLKEK